MIILKLPSNYNTDRIIKHSPFISNEIIPVRNKWKIIYNILILSHKLSSKHNTTDPVFNSINYRQMKYKFIY